MILQCHLAHTLIYLIIAAEVTFKSNVMTPGHISNNFCTCLVIPWFLGALDNTSTIVIQHHQYVSTYRHVSSVLKPVGTRVEAGESIGLMDGTHELLFELWKAGQPVQPEEVIMW